MSASPAFKLFVASLPPSVKALNPDAVRLAGERVAGSPKEVKWRTAVDATARRDGQRVTLTAKGLRLVSELNAREHHHVRARRAAWQREVIASALRGIAPPTGPYVVTVERSGPRAFDDDNLQGAGKHLRDQVAAWLGCGDSARDPVAWVVTQRRGDYCVRVVVEGAPSVCSCRRERRKCCVLCAGEPVL